MTKRKANFVGGQLFWDMFLAYRVAWIMGRYGAGKTSLAVLMSARLLAEKRVKRIVSNIPIDFAEIIPPGQSLVPLFDSGILLDEAWIHVESRQAVFDYAAFIRKFNHFLLLPSVFPIHPRLSYFFVQRVYNAYTIGFPFWFYKWNISNKGIKEHGYFAISNPTAIFGHYPSDFVPGDDGGISESVTKTAISQGFKGTKKQQSKTKSNASDDTPEELFETMEDTAMEMGDVSEEIRKAAKAIRRSAR